MGAHRHGQGGHFPRKCCTVLFCCKCCLSLNRRSNLFCIILRKCRQLIRQWLNPDRYRVFFRGDQDVQMWIVEECHNSRTFVRLQRLLAELLTVKPGDRASGSSIIHRRSKVARWRWKPTTKSRRWRIDIRTDRRTEGHIQTRRRRETDRERTKQGGRERRGFAFMECRGQDDKSWRGWQCIINVVPRWSTCF